MIELQVQETETEYFRIGPQTASKLEISEDDILLAKNPSNDKKIAGEARIDDSVEEKNVLIPKALFESIGLDEASEMVISAYKNEVKKPTNVDFEVEGREGLDEAPLIKENEEEFIDFITDRLCTSDSEILWEDKELVISVEETDLEIEKDDVIEFTKLEEFSFNMVKSRSDSYSSLLLIDISGSMETRDLTIEDIDSVVEEIHTGMEEGGAFDFLENLKGKSEIKRSQGVAISGLAFLAKEREDSNKLSVVLFSDEASVVEFNGQKYFSTEIQDMDRASEDIIEEIRYHPRGRTNISAVLNEAVETMKDLGHRENKMLILVTDGEPHPPSVDDKENVENVLENRLAPRRDVTINTIGIGDEVDHNLLDKMASETGGGYTYVKSLEDLIEAHSTYSDSISSDNLYT